MLLALSGCSVDLRRGTVTFDDGSSARLTDRETRLLAYLAERPGVDVSRDELLTDVWDYAATVVSRAPDHAIKRLRVKIERDPKNPEHLLTVHGQGYRFEPLEHEQAPPEPAATRGVLRFEGCTLDLDRMRIQRGDDPIGLTATEARVLEVLHERGVVHRSTLARELWGRASATRAVDACLSRLRRKLGPGVLRSQRGLGVSLAEPSAPEPSDPDFVGRQPELEAIRSAFSGGALLISLLGPGGIGKSTLARHAAPDAIWIDLVGTSEGVLAAMCAALGVPAEGDPTDRRRRLRRILGHHGCAVIDNCELVRDELCEILPDLLDSGCTILATSRIPLGLPLEHRIAVDPLDATSAAALFHRRVRQACAGRPPELGDAEIRALVEALDGIPLAIELAAARAAFLPPKQLIERLDLDLLRKGTGRHGTMRTVVQGSWDLLPPHHRQALAVLSRLPGGFSLELAEAALGRANAVDALAGLRDASLVRPVGPGRLAPFVPVRELALEKPVSDDTLEPLLAALAALGTPESLARSGRRGGHEVIEALRAERLNLEAAIPLARAVAPQLEPRLALAIATLAADLGPARHGVDRVRQALPNASPALRPHLHLVAARCHAALNDLTSARAELDAALDASAPGSEIRAVARARLALIEVSRHAFESAERAWIAAEHAAREAGRDDLAALAAAAAAYYPDLDSERALEPAQRAVTRAAAGDDLELLGRAAVWHGKLCWYRARWADARRSLRTAAEACEQTGADNQRARAVNALISVQLECGDHDGIEALLDWGLELGQRTGDANQQALMHLLRGMARMATDDPKQAEIELNDALDACGSHRFLVRWATSTVASRLWLRLGDLRSAEQAVGRAIDGYTEAGLRGHLGTALLVRSRVLAEQGDLDGARGLLAEARPLVIADEGRDVIELAVVQGWIDLHGDRLDTAAAHLERARRLLVDFGLRSPLAPAVRHVQDLAEAIGTPG